MRAQGLWAFLEVVVALSPAMPHQAVRQLLTTPPRTLGQAFQRQFSFFTFSNSEIHVLFELSTGLQCFQEILWSCADKLDLVGVFVDADGFSIII
jgi:hypothetical protein